MPKEWQKTRTEEIDDDMEKMTVMRQDRNFEAKKLGS
jgi:hypothetical protein